MPKRLFFSIFICILIGFLFPVDAIAKKKKRKKKKRKKTKISLTIDPVYLTLPMALKLGYVLDLAGEYRAHKKVGVTLGGGFGSLSYANATLKTKIISSQVRWYPMGHFRRGMQLGGQILYANAEGNYTKDYQDLVSFLFQGGIKGVSIGTFLGYKYVFKPGFTMGVQLGVQKFFGSVSGNAKAKGGGAKAESDDYSLDASTFAPIVNTRMGWSF